MERARRTYQSRHKEPLLFKRALLAPRLPRRYYYDLLKEVNLFSLHCSALDVKGCSGFVQLMSCLAGDGEVAVIRRLPPRLQRAGWSFMA